MMAMLAGTGHPTPVTYALAHSHSPSWVTNIHIITRFSFPTLLFFLPSLCLVIFSMLHFFFLFSCIFAHILCVVGVQRRFPINSLFSRQGSHFFAQLSPSHVLHSKKKSTSEHFFWCFSLSQIEDSIQYLEGPNSPDGPQDSYHGPSRYYLVLPGIEQSPLFVTTWSTKKGALKYFSS